MKKHAFIIVLTVVAVVAFIYLPRVRLAEGAESPGDDCRCYGAPPAMLWLWMSLGGHAASTWVLFARRRGP